ncbi:MAG: hypothetical protein FH758_05235 [Firmicutes bacterium]|nr:hypothetical protein [Bacillota bacterium]
MNDIPKEVLTKVQKAAEDNRLSCTMARKLADELNVPPKVVGKAADQLNVKIKSCELGCF